MSFSCSAITCEISYKNHCRTGNSSPAQEIPGRSGRADFILTKVQNQNRNFKRQGANPVPRKGEKTLIRVRPIGLSLFTHFPLVYFLDTAAARLAYGSQGRATKLRYFALRPRKDVFEIIGCAKRSLFFEPDARHRASQACTRHRCDFATSRCGATTFRQYSRYAPERPA